MAKVYYGGQAVIEGVMMRGRTTATVVVRKRDGTLVDRTEELPGGLYGSAVSRLPLIRGLVMLWEMLILGMRMMLFSANVQARSELDQEIPTGMVAAMLTFSLAFAVGIFFILPLLLTRGGLSGVHGPLANNAVEGAVRLLLFVGYLLLIGRLGQMHRVFQYHGAEHKTINAYESGAELTPRSVQRFTTIHPRCGTAFLLWVVVLSIFVFALLGHQSILAGVAWRVALIPLIAAVSYEILRLAARLYSHRIVRVLVAPGLWLQRLTTREPTDDQVSVAIAALRLVLAADGSAVAAAAPGDRGVIVETTGVIT